MSSSNWDICMSHVVSALGFSITPRNFAPCCRPQPFRPQQGLHQSSLVRHGKGSSLIAFTANELHLIWRWSIRFNSSVCGSPSTGLSLHLRQKRLESRIFLARIRRQMAHTVCAGSPRIEALLPALDHLHSQGNAERYFQRAS